MKIIDLLNKIANGEQPPNRIKYSSYVFKYTGDKRLSRMYVMEHQETYLFRDMVATLTNEVKIIEDKPSEEIRKLQSEIDILTNKVEHYYSEVVSFRDKTRYLKDELKKLKED